MAQDLVLEYLMFALPTKFAHALCAPVLYV